MSEPEKLEFMTAGLTLEAGEAGEVRLKLPRPGEPRAYLHLLLTASEVRRLKDWLNRYVVTHPDGVQEEAPHER